MDKLLLKKLGNAIHNMFSENWKNFELGSKQVDLIEKRTDFILEWLKNNK